MDLGGHEAAALLTLLRTRERGTTWSSIATEVADHGSAVALLEAQHDGELFPSAQLEQAQADAQEQLRNWATAGYRWVTVLDDTYPAQLRDIREAPPFLFYAGHLQPDERGVSIVGSRNASAAALGFASEAARYLVGTGLSVLSGLADGIDTAAHSAALTAGGRTVAFLGTGIARSYPAQNRALQQEISERGLLLSQFYPEAAPTKHTFPMRNAIMSGYGIATLIVEAHEYSGTRIQARVAREHGRPVILTRDVVDTTTWGREAADTSAAYVIDSIDELADTIRQIRELDERMSRALAELTVT